MIPKLDQNLPIVDNNSSRVVGQRPSSPTTASPKPPRKPLRRGSAKTAGGGAPSPPVRRMSIESSCSSINSTDVIPSAITTTTTTTITTATTTTDAAAQQALHHSSNGGGSSASRLSPPRSTSKAVSFNKRVRIRKIKRLEDMSEEEIEAVYFTDRELMDIRNDLRANIRSLVETNYREDQHETVDDYADGATCFCVRGLEHELPRGKLQRKQLKGMSRGAVLEEQRLRRQFRVGRNNSGKNNINGNSNNSPGKNSISSHSTYSTSTVSTCDSSINSFASPSQHVMMINEEADTAISEIYRIESKPAVQLALEFAKRDEAIADQIYFAHQAI